MKMKKLFALFLALTMTVSSVPQVYAGELLIEDTPVEEDLLTDDLLTSDDVIIEEEAPAFEDELTVDGFDDASAADITDDEFEIYEDGDFVDLSLVGAEAEYYYVTFIYNDGTTPDYKDQYAIPAAADEKLYAVKPEDPSRDGYDFLKWSKKNAEDGEDFFEANDGKGEELKGDIALYAIWDAHDVTVTYSAGTPEGGFDVDEDYDLPADTIVDFGTEGTALVDGVEAPTAEGNVFDGWYVGDVKIEDYTVDAEPSIEVTAHWKIDTGYGIELVKGIDADEIKLPELPKDNGKFDYGTYVEIADPDPSELDGQVFQGWSVNGDTENLVRGGILFDKDTTQEGTIKKVTLTGVWKLYEGYVWFYDEDGEILDIKDFTYGGSVVEPKQPEKEGYTWTGWRIGSETGEPFNAQKVEFTYDVDVYPSWDINTFTVTFKEAVKDEKTGKFTDDVREDVEYDSVITDIPQPEKEGMEFLGWFYTEDGKEVEFTDETPVKSNLTLTAKYDAEEYSITFENTKGSKYVDDKNVAAIKAKYGETVGTAAGSKHVIKDLKDVDNYHFLGWYYTVVENGKEVEKKLADAPTTVPVDGLVLTAKWQAYYTITFINEQTGYASDAGKDGKKVEIPVEGKDGAEAEIGTEITLKKADIEGFADPESTEDYYFWYWEKDDEEFIFTEDATKKIPATKIDGDATITAKWTQFFTITLDPNGGEIEGSTAAITKRVPAEKSYNEFFGLEKYTEPEATLAGNELIGWLVSGTYGYYNFDGPVDGAKRLVAFWIPEGSTPVAEDTKGNNYLTLAEANAKAAEGDTLKLVKDKVSTGENGVQFTKNFILDLNGNTLTGDIAVASGKKLTIKDSQGTGTVSDSQLSGAVVIAGGTYLNVTLAADAAVTIDPAGSSKFDESTKDQLEAANNEGTVFDPDKYMLAQTQSSSGYYVLTEYATLTFNFGDYPGAPSPKAVKIAKGDKTKAPAQDAEGKWDPVEVPERAYDENDERLEDGFEFGGWYTDTTFKTAFTFGKTLTKNTTVYANWIGYHTVTFIYETTENNKVKEEIFDVQEVSEGKTATDPGAAPVDDFEFWGTRTVDGKWTEYDFSAKVTKSLTLYAKSKAVVTFYVDGEEWDAQPVVYGGKATKPDPDPTKANAVFEGWYYADENGNASDKVFEFNTRIYDDVDLVAVWNLTEDWQFTKVYSDVATLGGAGTLTQAEIDYAGTEDKPIIIKNVKDWSPYEGSKDVLSGYYLGYQLEAPSSITSANINKYSICYDGKNWVALADVVDDNTNTNGNYVVNVFEPVQLTNLKTWADAGVPVEIKTYKIALTSDTDNAQELTVTFDPNYVEVLNQDGESELTIIDYIYNIHTVTFDSRMDGITVKDQAVADGKTAKDPTTVDEELKLEADGYEFQYWTAVEPSKWKAENPDNAAAQGPEEYTFTEAVKDDVTLYGYWHKVYTVTFVTRDGSDEVTFREGVHRTTIEKAPEFALPAGAHGWIDDNNVEFKGNSTYDANWTLKADLTLYAQYNVSNITFNFLNNDLAEDSYTRVLGVEIGNYLTDKIDSKTGDVIVSKTEKDAVKTYEPKNMDFAYWTLDEPDEDEDGNLTNKYAEAPAKFDPSKNLVQKDMTLYAYWKNETVKVTFKYADGSETVIDANKGEALPEEEYPKTKEYGAYWTAVAPAEDGTWADRPAKWGVKRTFESDSTLYEYAPEEPVDVIFNFNDGKTEDKKVVVNKGDVVPKSEIPALEAVGAYWTRTAPKDGEWEDVPEEFKFDTIIEETTTLYAYTPDTYIVLSDEMIAIDPGKTEEVSAELMKYDTIVSAEIEDKDLATVEFTNDAQGTGTIKVTAGDHYGLTTVTVTTKGGATAELKVRVHFDDEPYPSRNLHYDAVYWAADNGITTGWDDNTFRPMNNVTRAAAVTFLWRVAGKPEPKSQATFVDMPENEEFCKAISWACENGIVTGWPEDNTFRPYDTCKRAAIITFIWRYAGKPQATGQATFDDMPDNPEFAEAINWGVSEGIVHGWEEDNTFRPWDTSKRHAMVQFLYAYENQ